MASPWRDARGPRIVTRGNVDGILSAAVALAAHPEALVSFVPSSSRAVEVVRRDISHDLVLIDLGLTPKLVRALNDKAKTRQSVLFLDHHQQSHRGRAVLGDHVETVVREGASATAVALDRFDLDGLAHLAALADRVEYCRSRFFAPTQEAVGTERIEEEARHLDYAWRFRVEDDRFRLHAARTLAQGLWPSEVGEVKRRFLVVHNEGRFERAKDRVRDHLRLRGQVAILEFGKRKPSLMGFGSRALSAVARETEADLAVMVNRRNRGTSLSLRGFNDRLNLGLFVERFTREHGMVGGGHPSSAGARIHTDDVPQFLDDLVASARASA